jgi:NAD(P)-dependent dehydrogenase (short-subunit alcohol dehydrogenase family)
VVHRLTEQGAHVMMGARGEDRLQALSEETGAPYQQTDATSFEAVEQLFRAAIDRFERIDGVLNSVGSILLKPAHLTSRSDWDATVHLNLTSAFAVIRAAGRTMSKDGGSVVLLSTGAARIGLANHEAIAAAKAGIEGLTRSAAATYAAKKIRFNVVAPGLVETPLSERITSSARGRETSLAMHPLRRLGAPDDIARAVEWFLSPRSDWITGQVLGVDGGLASIK